MTAVLQKAERLLIDMTPAEKAQILQWIIKDIGNTFPGIESSQEICGGVPCIVRTRIPVYVLVQAKLSGLTDAEVLKCYPTLKAEYLTDAWAYYRTHQCEIIQQMADNEEED